MVIDKKVIVIIVLSIALAVVSYIAFGPKPVGLDEELINGRIDQLTHVNDSLLKDIDFHKGKEKGFLSKIDSLNKEKNKISTQYVSTYKKIDSLSNNGIVSELQSIFAKSGVK